MTARRFLRPRSRQPAHQRHRPLQHPLLLLHAGDGRAVRRPRARSWPSKRSSASCASPSRSASRKLRVTGGEPLVRRDLPVLIRTSGRDSRHPRSGADHQRRAAGRAGASRSTTPACAGSTSTSTRSTASASSRSRGATISARVLDGHRRRAKRLGYRRSRSTRSR